MAWGAPQGRFNWFVAMVSHHLRNYQDNETRWLAGRASAARAERRRRRHHLATHSIQTEDLPPEETTTP